MKLPEAVAGRAARADAISMRWGRPVGGRPATIRAQSYPPAAVIGRSAEMDELCGRGAGRQPAPAAIAMWSRRESGISARAADPGELLRGLGGPVVRNRGQLLRARSSPRQDARRPWSRIRWPARCRDLPVIGRREARARESGSLVPGVKVLPPVAHVHRASPREARVARSAGGRCGAVGLAACAW